MVETLVGDKSSVTTAKYTLASPQAPHSAWSAQTFCNPCQKLSSPTCPNPPNENLIAKICLISSHNCHCKNGCLKIPAIYRFFSDVHQFLMPRSILLSPKRRHHMFTVQSLSQIYHWFMNINSLYNSRGCMSAA